MMRAPGAGANVPGAVRHVDGLLLMLALLYLLAAYDSIAYPAGFLLALGVFGGVLLLFQFTPLLRSAPALRLASECAAMVVFVTVLALLAGGQPGALLNLYLLPVITAALSQGRSATLLQLGLVVAARILLLLAASPGQLPTFSAWLGLSAELAPVFLVALFTAAMASDITAAARRIQELAAQDGLTGLYNARAFEQLYADEHDRAVRRGSSYAVLMADVDGLARINQEHGREAGNRALVAAAQAIRRSTRNMDLVCRYGGDEFLVYLAGADEQIATMVSNRIRHNVFATTLDTELRMVRISVNVGAAVFPDDGSTPRALVQAAAEGAARERDWRRGAPDKLQPGPGAEKS